MTVQKYVLTAIIICAAIAAAALQYKDYITNPWTRNGQVMSYVIQVTSRVTGPIIRLPIINNQSVKAGDLLFEIDPRTFKVNLDQARANYDKTIDDIKALEKQVEATEASVSQFKSSIVEAESSLTATISKLEDAKATYKRYQVLVPKGATSKQRFDESKKDYDVACADTNRANAALLSSRSALLQSQASLAQARANLGASGADNARLRSAKAAVEQAELNLEFTRVKASVDGYITNLNLQLGSQAVANQPAMALVNSNSFWVDGYFRETLIEGIKVGDSAVVTLMSYPGKPITGKVKSLGWGIAQDDGSSGHNLLPDVSPTFEWIRLAQRIPVSIQLDTLPDGVQLRSGTTASVLVMAGQ